MLELEALDWFSIRDGRRCAVIDLNKVPLDRREEIQLNAQVKVDGTVRTIYGIETDLVHKVTDHRPNQQHYISLLVILPGLETAGE